MEPKPKERMADMCFGVNETRLATKRLDGLFTVGRVQTPTLGLVVKRDEAIARHADQLAFVCQPAGAQVDFETSRKTLIEGYNA